MDAKLQRFLALVRTPDLPDLGPLARQSRLPIGELDQRLNTFHADAGVPEAARLPLRAVALLWHDYLAESHAVSQGLNTPEGSFLHGIMHRREPDFGNARYWFHRLGRHAAFYEISRAATPLLVHRGAPQLATQLLPNGLWDPFAFVDACAAVAGGDRDDPVRTLLREVQQVEFAALVQHILTAS